MKLLIGLLAYAAMACGQGEQGVAPAPPTPAPVPGGPGVIGTLLVGNKGENTLSFIDLASGRELGRAETGRRWTLPRAGCCAAWRPEHRVTALPSPTESR